MKFRIQDLKQFSVMPNYHLQDKKLSLQAKGLLSVIFSLPNEWDYSLKGLCTVCGSKLTQTRNAIFELELYGYIERKETRKNGKFDVEYTVYITPKKPSLSRPLWAKKTAKKTKNEDLTALGFPTR